MTHNEDMDTLAALLATHLEHYFARVVLAYQQRLYAFVLRQIGSPQEAEDIVQETFIQAYYALDSYSPQRIRALKLQPWLYKIALNIFYNRVRGSKQRLVSLDSSENGPHLAIEDDQRLQPERIVEERESLRELERFVVQLPPHYRETVNLFYFEGLSYQEIVAVLDIPLGTVKSNLHRGIHLLRKALIPQQRGAQ